MRNSLIPLLLIICFGCKSVKVLDKETNCFKPTTYNSIQSTFKNQADSNFKYEMSLLYLIDHNIFCAQDILPNWEKIEVSIEVKEKNIIFTGKYKDSVVYSKSIKGEQKLNYFKTRKIRFKGIPPVFYQYDESLLLFSLNKKGGLSLIQNQRFIGGFLFIMGNNYEKNCLEYSLVKSN